MKRRFSIILVALCAACCAAVAQKSDERRLPAIKFDTIEYDFGTIKESDGPVTHTFVYTNTGTAPLAVMSVTVNCGCTTREYTKKPVSPGKKGHVTLSFSPRGYKGAFTKTATVTTNVKGKDKKIILKFTGNVLPE